MANPTKRIIVKFRPAPEITSQKLGELCERIAAITNGILVRPPSASGRAVFQVEASSDLDHLIQEVQKLPWVEYAESDVIDRISRR